MSPAAATIPLPETSTLVASLSAGMIQPTVDTVPVEGWHINTVTPDVGTLQVSLNTHLAQQCALVPTTVSHSRRSGRPESIVLVSENDPELRLKFESNRKAYQHMGMTQSQFKAMRADGTVVNGWRVKKMDAQRQMTRFNHGKPHTATSTSAYTERRPLQQTPSQMPFDDVSATQRQLQAPQQARNRVPSGGQVHTVNAPVVSEEPVMQPCALHQGPSVEVRDTLKPVVVIRIPKTAVPKGRTRAQASIRLSAKLRADATLVKATHRQKPVTVYASPQTGSSHPRKKSATAAANESGRARSIESMDASAASHPPQTSTINARETSPTTIVTVDVAALKLAGAKNTWRYTPVVLVSEKDATLLRHFASTKAAAKGLGITPTDLNNMKRTGKTMKGWFVQNSAPNMPSKNKRAKVSTSSASKGSANIDPGCAGTPNSVSRPATSCRAVKKSITLVSEENPSVVLNLDSDAKAYNDLQMGKGKWERTKHTGEAVDGWRVLQDSKKQNAADARPQTSTTAREILPVPQALPHASGPDSTAKTQTMSVQLSLLVTSPPRKGFTLPQNMSGSSKSVGVAKAGKQRADARAASSRRTASDPAGDALTTQSGVHSPAKRSVGRLPGKHPKKSTVTPSGKKSKSFSTESIDLNLTVNLADAPGVSSPGQELQQVPTVHRHRPLPCRTMPPPKVKLHRAPQRPPGQTPLQVWQQAHTYWRHTFSQDDVNRKEISRRTTVVTTSQDDANRKAISRRSVVATADVHVVPGQHYLASTPPSARALTKAGVKGQVVFADQAASPSALQAPPCHKVISSCCHLPPSAPPCAPILSHSQRGKSILGVIHGVLLWADINAANPLWAWGRSVMSLE